MEQELKWTSVKYMNIKEFVDEGYLQEVNRQFFHPLGLALEVSIEDDNYWISGIWDERENLEGFIFDKLDKDKTNNIQKQMVERRQPRNEKYNCWMQKEDDR